MMALSRPNLFSNLSFFRLSIRTKTASGSYSHHSSCFSRRCSSSDVQRGPGRSVGTKLQSLNSRYERFLKRRFPRFFQLYHTFVEGFKLLFRDAKEVQRIKMGMLSGGARLQDLPYRDQEKLRQVRRDLIKALPLLLISLPPFANYLVFVLMYFFPRQILIPHFWSPGQQVEFRGVYHSLRARHHRPVLAALQDTSQRIQDGRLRSRLLDLCAKVQGGQNPHASEILAVRVLFSGPPLGLERMQVDHLRHLSPLLALTPRLPAFLLGRRLQSHGLELLWLDRALATLGPQQLSDWEIREACYLRGINSHSLQVHQCRDWLSHWLRVSSSLKDSEVSLLLHCLVFLSAHQPSGSSPPSKDA